MRAPMDILLAAAEVAPYVERSPTAEAVAALAKTLKQLGHEVTLAVPRTAEFEEAGLLVARRLTPLALAGGAEVIVYDAQLASGARLVLLDVGPPGDADRAGSRAAAFCFAVAAYVRQRREQGRPLDAVHAFDAATGFVPLALTDDEHAPRSVFTVGDVEADVTAAAEELIGLGAARDTLPEAVGGRVSALGCGVALAGAVTAPSATYAEVLAQASPVSQRLAERDDPIQGIEPGVDYALYNPAVDLALPARFDAEDPSNKGRVKTAFLNGNELDLELDPERPLLVVPGPITAASGFDALLAALPRVLDLDVTVVVVGIGEGALVAALERAATEARGRMKVIASADPAMLRRALGAADLALILPRSGAGGALHLAAQRYGALPVAHGIGALRDGVVDADAQLVTGTGFLVEAVEADALVAALQRAVAAFGDDRWPALRRRVMRLDSSWDRPARRYLRLYQR